jgi:hypothetical protein
VSDAGDHSRGLQRRHHRRGMRGLTVRRRPSSFSSPFRRWPRLGHDLLEIRSTVTTGAAAKSRGSRPR